MSITEIILKYTSGEKTLEETNAALKEKGATFHLDPNKNVLTADEIANGTAGLLDTGTGSFDKVQIVNGELTNAVNTVMENGSTSMKAFVLVGDNMYEVFGTKLVKV